MPVLGALAFATLIEVVVPLRSQPRRLNGRLVTNLWLLAITLALGMLLNFTLALGAAYVGASGMGLLQLVGIGAVASFIVGFLALDEASYLVHRLLHQIPTLWRVHLVHHIDASVDVTTAFRQHPIEGVLRFSFIALTAWALGAPPAAIAVYRLLGALNSVMEHANIRMPRWFDRALVWFWVTPRYAQGASLTRAARDGFELRESVFVFRSSVRIVYAQLTRAARSIWNPRLRRARPSIHRRRLVAAIPRTRLACSRRGGNPGCCRRKQ